MYYKIILNGKTIDLLDRLKYTRYSEKAKRLYKCDYKDAEGIFSSDCLSAYHINTCPKEFSNDIFPSVDIEEITKIEYDQLKKQHLMSYEDIIDNYTQELIEGGLL